MARRTASVATVLAQLVAACTPSEEPGAARRLEREILRDRFIVARLAGQTSWQPCVTVDSTALIPRTECGKPLATDDPRFDRIGQLDRATLRYVSVDSSASGLRALALVKIRWPDTTATGADRAVVALEEARQRAPNDVSVLNDLAAAYVALAERSRPLPPMLRALDAIEQAVARDSTRPEILFNRALILERLYLVASAERAWSQYLTVERQSDWRAEGVAHQRRLAAAAAAATQGEVPDALLAIADSLSPTSFGARVRHSPQAVREFGLKLLGEWGRAVDSGQVTRAAGFLNTAHAVASALEVEGADRSLARTVAFIDTVASDAQRLRALARAHATLGTGVRLYLRDSAASLPLDSAEQALRALGSPAARWSAFYRAAALVGAGHYAEGDDLLLRSQREASRDEPALIGKTLMGLGVSQGRRGNYERATSLYREAAPFMTQAKEREQSGLRSFLLSESLGLSGQILEQHQEAYLGLRLLSPFRRSNYLNNQLRIVAAVARADGLSHASLAIQDEQIFVARAVNKPDVLALAFSARAADLAAVGRPYAADAALVEASEWASRVTADRTHARVRAILSLRRGQIGSGSPLAALAVLTAAVDSLRVFQSDVFLPTALYHAALAALQVGRRDQAREWLVEAISGLERQHSVFSSTVERAAFSETVENVFDAIVDLERQSNRLDGAFEYLERGRVAAWPPVERQSITADRHGAGGGLAAVQAALPDDMLLVEYAMTRDSVIAFAISRRSKTEHRLARRDSLVSLIDELPPALRLPEVGPADARARLFDILLRPLADDLRGIRRIAIVPDRELYRVPFVALWDKETAHYAIETYEFRTVPSAAFLMAALPKSHPADRGSRVLVIGNPAIDTALALPSLRGAGTEADSVAGLYPDRAWLLEGPNATRAKLLEYLPVSSIMHFAGHAVFNSDQPELSFLALAGDGTGRSGGILRAREIGELRLSNTQVVVLSACSTLNPRSSRMGAIAGLAFSFLRAGVPATISTLWDIGDDATTRLLIDFHRRLANHESAPRALQQAQQDALRSPTRELRAPRTWAAFTYTGP